jgi:aminoglycoside/choline kinase family phosphotransferase
MKKRDQLLDDFLANSEWRSATTNALAGDASQRRYTRLHDENTHKRAIMMDAPPEKGEDVRPFLQVAAYLSGAGLSAPQVFEVDKEQGFLILEDFGNDLFDVVCDANPDLEETLYAAAVDALTQLVQQPPLKGAKDYHPVMVDLALSSYRWYAEPIVECDMSSEAEACRVALTPLVASLGEGRVTILRDFHAQNLLWLPDRSGVKNVGMLDFQDAMLGHPAYDLISLTTDARRDVSLEVQKMCLQRFAENLDLDQAQFERDAAICSVQRNLRILMIFARMSLHFKRPHYVDLIPRVWAHLMNDLSHPDLCELSTLVRSHLPEPTPEILMRLKEKCGTVSTL